MDTDDDNTLLRRFATTGDESAFRVLTDRYINLVYGTARRHSLNHHMAEEVTQEVFSILARKAGALGSHPTLGGWLFRTSFYEATKAMRAESKQQENAKQWKEVNASLLESVGDSEIPEETVAVLDEALNNLPDKDRELIVMRFYRSSSFRDIGSRFGISENAGQKRVTRILEKLGGILKRKGVSLPGTTLVAVLVTTLGKTPAAPAGLSSTVSSQALASMGTGSGLGLFQPILWHVKMAALVAFCAATMVPLGHRWIASSQSRTNIVAQEDSESSSPVSLASTSVDLLADDPLFGDTMDPAERMRRILELEDKTQRLAEIRFLVRKLSDKGLPIALGILAERDPEDHEHLEAFVESWAGREPRAAIEFVATRSEVYRDGYGKALMKGWVEANPDEAWEYVSTLPADSTGELLLNSWAQELSYTDGGKVIALLGTRPERFRSHHFDQVFRNWPKDQFDQALETIASLKDSTWTDKALESLLKSSGMKDHGIDLLPHIRTRFGNETAGRFESKVYSAWANADPLAAITHVRSMNAGEARDRAARAVASAGHTFEAIADQLKFMNEFLGDDLNGRRRYLIGSWLMQDVGASTSFVAKLAPEEQAPFASTLGAYFGQRDPDGAVEWSRNLTDTETRQEFLTHLLRETAKVDFEAALTLMDRIPDQDSIADAVTDIADAYAQREPESAMIWALENGTEDNVGEAAGRAMRWWAKTDSTAASEWLAEREPGAFRDEVAAELVDVLYKADDNESAVAWALSVEDDNARQRLLDRVAEHWTKSDARSSRDWFDAQSDAVRDELLAGKHEWTWLIGWEEGDRN